jgi:hypothetical protein
MVCKPAELVPTSIVPDVSHPSSTILLHRTSKSRPIISKLYHHPLETALNSTSLDSHCDDTGASKKCTNNTLVNLASISHQAQPSPFRMRHAFVVNDIPFLLKYHHHYYHSRHHSISSRANGTTQFRKLGVANWCHATISSKSGH